MFRFKRYHQGEHYSNFVRVTVAKTIS
jgi:hypothetical protein